MLEGGTRDEVVGGMESELVPTPSLPTLRVGPLPFTRPRAATPSKLTLPPLQSIHNSLLVCDDFGKIATQRFASILLRRDRKTCQYDIFFAATQRLRPVLLRRCTKTNFFAPDPQSLLSSRCNIKRKMVTNQSLRLFSHHLILCVSFSLPAGCEEDSSLRIL